ncbi:hypothetical protein LLG88_13520 [bacterium]|nr:hypothetical protein [bacterium]
MTMTFLFWLAAIGATLLLLCVRAQHTDIKRLRGWVKAQTTAYFEMVDAHQRASVAFGRLLDQAKLELAQTKYDLAAAHKDLEALMTTQGGRRMMPCSKCGRPVAVTKDGRPYARHVCRESAPTLTAAVAGPDPACPNSVLPPPPPDTSAAPDARLL